MKQMCEQQISRIEGQSQWLNSISAVAFDNFDSTSITLASKLAMEIRKRSGIIISLHDENLVRELGKGVVALDESDLNFLYRSLLEKVKKALPQEVNVIKGVVPQSRKSRILSLLSRRKRRSSEC